MECRSFKPPSHPPRFSTGVYTGLVDFYHSMNTINAGQQQKTPSFTIVGKDRIHPGPTGHFVMACCFLKATGVTPYVADVKLDARNGSVLLSRQAVIRNVKVSANHVEFEYLAESLPFPVAEEYLTALDLVPFTADLNREMLTVSHLPEGMWTLEIDGRKCGECSSADLSAGINLATHKETPQYQQAVGIMQLNARRQSLEGLLRSAANLEWFHAKTGLCPVENAEKVRGIFEEKLQAQRKSGKPNVQYMKLLEICADPGVKNDLLREIDEVVQKIRTEAGPKERKVRLLLRKD